MFLNLEYESSYVARLINLKKKKIKFSKHFNYKQTIHIIKIQIHTKIGTKFKNPLAEIRNRNIEMNEKRKEK